MPRLWSDTIEEHRREVRSAVVDTTAALIAEHGLLAVTMSRIAEETGIGRATLYKYFPDVEAILLAWHERQMAAHLQALVEASDRPGDATQRLHAVLEAYALMTNQRAAHGDSEFATLIHRHKQIAHAEHQLQQLIQGLLAEAVKSGAVRADVSTDELAIYCLSALAAAANLSSKAAIRRLVTVTLAGLRAPG